MKKTRRSIENKITQATVDLSSLGYCFGHVAFPSTRKELEYLKYIISRIDSLSLRIEETKSRLGRLPFSTWKLRDFAKANLWQAFCAARRANWRSYTLTETHISLIN